MIEEARLEPRQLIAEIERLLAELDALPDPVARATGTEAVRALIELYGAGLARIVEEIAARDDGELAGAFAEDELVSHLLLLHGLHPLGLEERVLGALEEVRPYLESHGGGVELLRIEGASLRLRLHGSCSGCPSSAITLKLAIENAIHKAAPEIEEVIAQEEPAGAPGLLQIELAPGTSPAGPAGEWAMVGGLPELSGGGSVVRQISGRRILFLKVGEAVYGYRPLCPGCEESLESAVLRGGELACSGCGNHYDVLRAGRCLDSPQLHLEPVPLLVGDDGLVKVALPVAA
jgi:Fe-S cluster biogenesis protein NfuA/nitrite reductase/ring-hydroxylating ferredoxin subunit